MSPGDLVELVCENNMVMWRLPEDGYTGDKGVEHVMLKEARVVYIGAGKGLTQGYPTSKVFYDGNVWNCYTLDITRFKKMMQRI